MQLQKVEVQKKLAAKSVATKSAAAKSAAAKAHTFPRDIVTASAHTVWINCWVSAVVVWPPKSHTATD